MKKKIQSRSSPTRKSYTFKIGFSLFQRLDKIVQNLTQIKNYEVSKQQWVTEAIKEKTKRDAVQIEKVKAKAEPLKRVTILIDETSQHEIQKQLETLRQSNDPCLTQNSWIIEAIQEKLAREE